MAVDKARVFVLRKGKNRILLGTSVSRLADNKAWECVYLLRHDDQRQKRSVDASEFDAGYAFAKINFKSSEFQVAPR